MRRSSPSDHGDIGEYERSESSEAEGGGAASEGPGGSGADDAGLRDNWEDPGDQGMDDDEAEVDGNWPGLRRSIPNYDEDGQLVLVESINIPNMAANLQAIVNREAGIIAVQEHKLRGQNVKNAKGAADEKAEHLPAPISLFHCCRRGPL